MSLEFYITAVLVVEVILLAGITMTGTPETAKY
jgi:hypothetical protein